MRSWRSLSMLLGFLAAAGLYYVMMVITVTDLWVPIPQWWIDKGAALGLSTLPTHMSWMHLTHGWSVAAAAMPLAIGIRVIKPPRPIAVAFALSLVALVVPNIWISYPAFFSTYSLTMQVSASLDLLKFLTTLPLLTWLLLQWRTAAPKLALAV